MQPSPRNAALLLGLLVLLSGTALAFPMIRRVSSPFLPCGADPSGQGLCVALSPAVFGELSTLAVGDRVEFPAVELDSARSPVVLTLTRFSASETLEDLQYVVLLRGAIFPSLQARIQAADPFDLQAGSSVFLALSQHGSNGFFELGNATYYLSTPFASVDQAKPDVDQYVADLAKSMKRAVGASISAFAHNRASVIAEKSTLAYTAPENVPKTDFVLPPADVIAETDALIDKARTTTGFSTERRTYRVATDVDFQMFRAKGSNYDATASYYYTLVGSASSIYARDFGSDIVSSYVYIYTTQDPYPYTTNGALDHMLRTWNPSNPSRSFATLVSAKALGGGLAYVRVLCNTNYAYGVNGNMVGYFPVPIRNNDQQNWDIYVWAHETGHIWGASHTHDLNPPADRCGSTPGCGATTGTIMSYCHLCSNGMGNIILSFHQYTKNEVLPFIGSVAC